MRAGIGLTPNPGPRFELTEDIGQLLLGERLTCMGSRGTDFQMSVPYHFVDQPNMVGSLFALWEGVVKVAVWGGRLTWGEDG